MRYSILTTILALAPCALVGQNPPVKVKSSAIPPPKADSVVAGCAYLAPGPFGGKKKITVLDPGVDVTLDPLTVPNYLASSFPYNTGLRFDFTPVTGSGNGPVKSFQVPPGTSSSPATQKQRFSLPVGNYELVIWGGTNGSVKYLVTVQKCILPKKSSDKPAVEL
jgi:hypothetical protein